MAAIGERMKNAWNAFMGRDPTEYYGTGFYSVTRPGRPTMRYGIDRTIATSIYNQIAVDCSSITINHVRLDDDGRFLSIENSSLNRALTLDPNIDQTGRGLIRDAVMSMLDEGVVAIVPVETSIDPNTTDSYKIYQLRTGKIIEWFPKHVRVEVYNDRTGHREQIILEKRFVSIIENPFYPIMNEPNSTLQRLVRVLAQLDRTNDELSNGRLDMIIQLPYVIKSEARKKEAEKRRKEIVAQLKDSQYGIAYTDGTEKVIQLNRSLENNLWEQAKELKEELFNQLGFSQSIFDGTADEATMLNYNNRTIEPIMSAITEEMERKWISKTAQSQNQGIRFFREPFKLVPVQQIADIADKFTRNEIISSNEMRAVIGMKPSKDPKADELRNSNLNHPDENEKVVVEEEITEKE